MVEMQTMHLEDMALEDELVESHYSRLQWATTTTETPVQIKYVQEPVWALVDHGSKINLMLMNFYKKGKCPINTKYEWKIYTPMRAT